MGQPILIDWENFTNILMSHLDYKTSKKKKIKLLGQLILLEHFTNIYEDHNNQIKGQILPSVTDRNDHKS